MDRCRVLSRHGAKHVSEALSKVNKLSRMPGTGSLAHLNSANNRTTKASNLGSPNPMNKAPIITTSITKRHIGQIVTIGGAQTGVLRYFGPTSFEKGMWCGIELDSPVGKNNGTVKGKTYFVCQSNHGIFAPVYKVSLQSELRATKNFINSKKKSRLSCLSNVTNGGNQDVSQAEPRFGPDLAITTRSSSVRELYRNRNAPASKTSHVVVVPSSQVNPPTTQVFIENGRSCSDNSNQAKSSGQNKSSSPASVILQDLPASTNATVVSLLEQRLQSLSGQLEAERQASQSKISSLELTREALSVVIQQQTSQATLRENQLQQKIENYVEQSRSNSILYNDKCKDVEALQTELNRERECHAEELAEVNKQHAKLVETLVADHSQALTLAKKESDEIIGKIRKEHVEEVEKLKEGFRLELEELTKDHKAVLNAHRNLSPHDLLVKEIQSLEVVVEMRNNEIRTLRTDLVNYKATIEELKDSQELVRTLHANKEDLNAQIDKNRKDKAVLQERIQDLEAQLLTLESEKSDLSRKYDQLCFKYQYRQEGGDGDLPNC